MPPVSFCTFLGDAEDMPFDWLRTCPAGALDGSGNFPALTKRMQIRVQDVHKAQAYSSLRVNRSP
jgi:hypothetical protein